MLNRSDLHKYQVKAVDHILQHPQSMLFLDMGLGKSICTLTAITDIFNAGVSMGVLVIAPLRVCQTVWAQEAKKWSHTKHLTSALVHGPHHKYRAIGQHKHIYLLNYEGIQWFVNQVEIQFLAKGRSLPFDTIVLDEITRLKNTRDTTYGDDPGSVRGEALLRLLKYVPRRIGLTGTPAPNGLEDLFGQYLVLDGGRRLGTSYLGFRERFFKPAGFGGYKSSITAIGKDHIHQLIADITIQMKGEDYLELPKITENVINIQLPHDLRKAYDKLELEMFLELDSGASIEAVNSLSLMSKALQFSNGAIYTTPELPEWEKIHDLKLDALQEIYDSHGQSPLLIGYQYKHDKERILKKFKKLKPVALDSKVKRAEAEEIVIKWNRGEIPMLIGHSQSIGHGLNLQFGSNHIVFFGLGYNLELYLQLIGRLGRQGQPEDRVFVHKILCADTLDQAVNDALHTKEATQDDLRESLQNYRIQKNMN